MLQLNYIRENTAEVIDRLAVKNFKTSPRTIIEDLDSIPFPARHLLPMDEYKILNMKLTTGTIISGRGCPYKCAYCTNRLCQEIFNVQYSS